MSKGTSTVQHFDADWHFLGATTTRVDGGSTTTQQFDHNWSLTSADVQTSSHGSTTVQHFDAHWQFQGATFTYSEGDNHWTQSFGSNWEFKGATVDTNHIANSPYVSTHETFDASWQPVEWTAYDSAGNVVDHIDFYANHVAVIGGTASGEVTEDFALSNGYLVAGGSLNIADPDSGESEFVAQSDKSSSYGHFSISSDGHWTYVADDSQAAIQQLRAGETLTDSFTVTSIDGSAHQAVSVTIHGADDAAVISVPTQNDVTEDASVGKLSVSGQLTVTDADHDQPFFSTVVIPAPGNLGLLTISADGEYTYSVDNAAVQGLAAGEVKVETFTVSSIDGTTKPVSFTIHGTQDAPVLNVATAAGQADDAQIALHIDAHTIESGTLGIVVITGIPDTFTLNHGVFVLDGAGDGHWEVPSDFNTLSTLALVPGPDAQAGTLTLHVSVASIEGGHQAVANAPLTVDVTGSEHAVSQRAVDGYIAGAFVFADANDNGKFDDGEASATTGSDGSFTLHNAHGTLIMTGGIDVSTGLAFNGTLKAPEGSTVVTPLTTLVASVIASAAAAGSPVSTTAATTQVAAAFGIDPTAIDINHFDPVSEAASGTAGAQNVLSAGVQVQSTVAQISAVGASQTDVFSAIAGAITTANTGTGTGVIDLSVPDTVAVIVSDSGVNGAAADLVTSTVSAANDSIQSATTVTQIAQAGQVAQGAAAADLASAAAGQFDAQAVAAIQSTYADPTALAAQVAAAHVAVLPPVVGTSGGDLLAGTPDIDTIDGREGNDQISGGDGADVLLGGAGNDRLTGNAGNDRIDGGQGFDRAIYSDATGGVTIDMAAGKASGAGVDSDALTNVEGIVGSGFADTYNAAGFTGDSGVAGTPVGFNEFEGGAGNDVVTGTVNALGVALTRISYVSATSGVTVDIQAGFADGDASVGHDTFGTAGINGAWGSSHNDTLLGSANPNGSVEVFAGMAGDDLIDGRGGFDRADYNTDPATTTGVVVHMAAGTVTGDATVGNDTLRSVEAVRGTNFADTYDAAGFGTSGFNIGSNGTFNEFTGNGGNDLITGNGNTRISFNNATAGVTVDFQAGSASGDASVGTDTFTGVNAVQGSNFADSLKGDGANNTFTGNGGDDFIDGRGGFDVASYNNSYFVTGGVTVDMAAGTAQGDASIGNDTLRSIEGVQGTGYADTYTAVGYGVAGSGASNIGNNGTFNQFEGVGGNDLITGNGNTRVIYGSAAAAVTVDLTLGTAHGTAAGDLAGIGTDAFTGVFSATGSAFDDTLIGDANSNMFVGGGGNDAIDGGAGGDVAIYNNGRGAYSVAINAAGVVTVSDLTANRDGVDTLTNVEMLQFTNSNVLVASGSQAAPIDLSDGRLFFNAGANPLVSVTGVGIDDYVKINQGLSGHQIDLGSGANDTVMLGVTGGYNLSLVGVEKIVGTGGNDTINLATVANGLSVDTGGGADFVNLASGANTIAVIGTATVLTNDFAAPSNDVLTLSNNVAGVNINLQQGINTLNLASGANSFGNVFSVDTINGSGSDDTLVVAGGLGTFTDDLSIDLKGGSDTLQFGGQYLSASLQGVEHLVGSAGDDSYVLKNIQDGLTVDLGGGNNHLTVASGSNSIAVTNVQSIGSADFFGGTAPASNDTLKLLNDVSGAIIDLAQGDNTLNLAAGTNSITTYNVQHVNGSASDDVLTMFDAGGAAVDLGAGNDTLNLVGASSVTITNVEHVNGGAFTDFITVTGPVGATVTGGGSADFITAGAGNDVIRYTDASESSSGYALDTVTNFDAAHDQFLLDNVAGTAGQVHFMVSGVLDGSAATPRAEAILVDVGGQQQIQIDVNGDGVIDTNDISVIVNGLSGTLGDANFAVITPNHAPTDILLSGAAIVPENSAPGSVVGLLSDMDPDAGDGATYALTSNLGGLFAIVNGNQIVTTAPLDFEQAASHQVTVQVTDTAGATFSKNFQIGVTNVNEAPTDVTLSNNTVAENSAANAVVGFLTAVDPDAGSTATYEMIYDGGGLFSLVGNQVVTTGPLDFEQAASHQITVRATDAGGLSVDRTFTISTTNVNEAPTAVLLSNSSVAENSAANTVVGALSALDPDASDSATFTLTSNPGGLFAILNGNLVTAAPLDFEQATSHSVTVRATDAGGLTHDTTFAIATTNINEAPTDISLSNTVIPQGTASGTVVGTLSALDPDAGDTFSYTLTDNAGGQFGISGGNIVVTSPLTTGTEQITVVATDAGGLSFQKTIGITVNGGALVVGTSGPDTLTGTTSDDTIQGLEANDRLQGLAGNDILDGGQGFDRAVYTEAASAITVNLAAGTVTGGSGSDTLIGIEGIVGSENADTFDATGFAGDTGILGTQIGFNEFEGRGGADIISGAFNSQGAMLTRISYANATGSVTVDLQAHSATGDSTVGTDILVGSGFAGVVGSAGADTLLGSNNANGTVEIFDGRAGADLINGRGGFDRADYSNDPGTASGITVNMAAGTVTGDGTVGTDTLRSVESVRGTNKADSYDATGFSGTSGSNLGSNGTFNEFVGMGGDDNIIGNNNTRISYINATGGVVVDMQTGATPQTGTADGDASTGHDTFSGVNNVQGSMFNDTIFGSNIASTETFYGGAGNDAIDGRGGFDLATYNNIYFSTGAITVNMGAGTVTGDASVGTDTLRSIEAVQGTNFNDTFNASTYGTGTALNIGNNGTFSQFEGLGGNDAITGNGNTRVIYSSAAEAVSINMAAGTASGGASVGNDTFTGVNSATGSNLADTYVATGFVDTGAFSSGTFNLFEGLGGADTITGNGSTRIAYTQAASGVSVDLSGATGNAHSIAASDGAGIGVDTILGGVNSVQGSNGADIITGGSGNEFFFGGAGADTLNGGGGNDTLTGQGGNDALDGGTGTDMASFTGSRGQYTVSTNGTTGVTTVTDAQGAARDGVDTLTTIEVLQFSDATVMLTAGTALNPVDISAFNLGAGQILGTGADDFLAVGGNAFGHQIDLGAGNNDTVSLASPNFYQLNLVNVEHVTGTTGNDNVNLVNNAAGLVVDLGDGTDNMTLAGGLNSLSVTNVEILTTTDFSGTAVNDTLTLQNNISGGMNVNLGLGDNTLNLAAGSNSFNELFGIQHVNGTASDDVLTVANSYFTFDNNGIIDLAGGNNTLNFGGGGFSMTALNIQHIVGNSLDNIVTLQQ
ncbi:VCBS domain-containing protein [Bradyrhizobium sp. 40]|nr:VCBS domain-containing protein [Bradyrhizobium sp. 40]